MPRGTPIALAGSVLLALAASSSNATTLYTPPFTGAGTCTLVNVGKKSLEVTIEAVLHTGFVAETSSANADPGEVALPLLEASFGTAPGYCRFTFRGSRNSVRAGFYASSPGPEHFAEAVALAR